MKKTNVSDKNSNLSLILNTHFEGKLNRARVKLIAMFITALCKVQTVNFDKLSKAFDTEAKADSSLRRIQRFIAGFSFDSNLIARLIFSLLPNKNTLRYPLIVRTGNLGKQTLIYLCWESYIMELHSL